MSERLLLALAGNPGSGKTKAGSYLAERHGFTQFAGGDYLEAEAAKQGKRLETRGDYALFQRLLRMDRGRSFMIDVMLETPGDRVVNIGIRNRHDVDAFLTIKGIIVALDCPLEERFARTAGKKPKYPTSIEDYWMAELPEYDNPDDLSQHTHYAMDRAHYWIDTFKPVELTRKALDKIVEKELQAGSRGEI